MVRFSAGSAAHSSQLGSRCYRRLRLWNGHILARAPMGTMRVVLSVASVSAIASASVVARAWVGRSCGGCAAAGTSLMHKLQVLHKKINFDFTLLFLYICCFQKREPPMPIYGYARVSTDGQSLASQDAQLRAA